MKKAPVRVVKKNTLDTNTSNSLSGSAGLREEFTRSTAHKISNNVMNWVDELRERKTIEMVNSFSLLAKAGR